jgi:micrococcal nuclease
MREAVRRSAYGVQRSEPSHPFAVRCTQFAVRKAIPLFCRILFLLLLCACGLSAQGGDSFTGVCVGVLDGDSIIVDTGHGKLEVRLEGIDAPEHGQEYGEESKEETRKLVLGKRVSGTIKDVDDYGRTVARIYVDDRDLCLMLVQAGAAWKYKYSKDFLLARAEKEARRARRGLWALPHPIQPWAWRKQHPR